MLEKVYAAGISTSAANPVTQVSDLRTLFNWVLNLVLAVGISLVTVMLALGFIKYITSQGDKAAVEQAQKWVTYAAIGGVGLFFVFAIKTVLLSLIGGGNQLNTGVNLAGD